MFLLNSIYSSSNEIKICYLPTPTVNNLTGYKSLTHKNIRNTFSLNWDDFRYFLALADQGTLSGAARQLRVTHATMARRLHQLEEEVGTVLFDQGPSGYKLTDKGHDIYPKVLNMHEQLFSVLAITENEAPEGSVRISATPFLCNEIVATCLPKFRHQFPHIDLEVIAENRNVSLSQQEAHLSLRLKRPETGEFIIRRVASMKYALYKSKVLEDIENVAPIIGYTDELDYLPESKWIAKYLSKRRTTLRTDSLSCQKSAIENGIGIGLLPIYATRNSSILQRIDTEPELPSREIWMVMRRSLSNVLRVRILADFLAEYFKSQHSTFEGK